MFYKAFFLVGCEGLELLKSASLSFFKMRLYDSIKPIFVFYFIKVMTLNSKMVGTKVGTKFDLVYLLVNYNGDQIKLLWLSL